MNAKRLLILVFLFNIFIFYSQDLGKINGRLILNDLDSKESVSQKTYVIVKSKTYIDSVKVDSNLKFEFTNIVSDTIRLYLSPRSYPNNIFYRFYLNKGETKNLNLPYSPNCPYGKSDTCPICCKKDYVIPIVYGLIMNEQGKEADMKNYKSGGCVISDCQPKLFCKRDETEF
ncbi:hypothetical protein HYN59_06955 [Flavobacterium album]|uniref:Uncharacterized protein n=1 Tax=Flavobacterium album TaxID=2175091 RepID=A0A2S1QWU8_9FLAO|nr:hypothetical protein [Flavobacterium album]AWH84878.1 hypothetical protein HYN59_06955 [Flavobacterium album]